MPIKVNGKTVGIMYGIINIDSINKKYTSFAKELDAQLFVYERQSGKFIIDTIDSNPGELSQLSTRQYLNGYSYEALRDSDSEYSSFKSIGCSC